MEERKRRQERRQGAIAEYKTLTTNIRQYNSRDHPLEEVQEQIKSDLARANELYPVVKKKLEGSSADARHLRELYALCQEVSKRINTTTKPLELRRIIQELKRTADNDEEFYQHINDHHVNSFLLTPPTFEFFYGALKTEELAPRERRRREPREKFSDSQAVTATQKDIEVDVDQDTTPKEVEHICSEIKKLKRQKQGKDLVFYETIVDPESFTNTVENIFHLSFLVKEGKIGLKRDSNKVPFITVESNEGGDAGPTQNGINIGGGAGDKRHQSILSFSMDDYNKWISSFNIHERSFAPR